MNLLQQAWYATKEKGGLTESQLAKEGRIALIRVLASDILSVQAETNDKEILKSQIISRGVTLKVSRMKVLDLIDQLPLIPSEKTLEFIFSASAEWHRKWHLIVDVIQPTTWRDFPSKMVASLSLVEGAD
jgi:hypothetical protein